MLETILKELREKELTLVAVSKTKPAERILEMYHKGQRIFGENRVQELTQKYDILPKDIQWHLIGHLQTNKVKYIAPFVTMVHSIDSPRLLAELNKQAAKNDRVIDCLLQFKIAQEDSKFGSGIEEMRDFLLSEKGQSFQHINIRGVMGMATFTDNQSQVRGEFKELKTIFDRLKSSLFSDKEDFDTISMGMSGDYKIAIEEGSTMVRIGSLLFASR